MSAPLPIDDRLRLRSTFRRLDAAREQVRRREAELKALRFEMMAKTGVFAINEKIAREMCGAK